MKLIIGLGNPGKEYIDTRHNIGFMVIDKLSKELGGEAAVWRTEAKLQAMTAKVGDVLLVKPQTYMNKSGESVAAIVRFYKLTPSDVWIIHDDMDLPMGKIRIREKGASAGHNGVQSVIGSLKTDQFVRFRLGIGRGASPGKLRSGFFGKGDDDIEKQKNKDGIEQKNETKPHHSVIDFVLSRFSFGEAGDLRKLIKNSADAVRVALTEGVDKAMTRYN